MDHKNAKKKELGQYPAIKIRILLFCTQVFLIEEVAEVIKVSRELILTDHVLDSGDLSD